MSSFTSDIVPAISLSVSVAVARRLRGTLSVAAALLERLRGGLASVVSPS